MALDGAAGRPAERAYVDAPILDLDGARRLAAVAAEQRRLPEPALVRAGMNAIFRTGDVALRVSAPTVDAAVSIDLARFWRARGLRVPVPVDDVVVADGALQATAWEWIDESDRPIDWEAVGGQIRIVHETSPHELPTGVPLPPASSFPWWDFDRLLGRTAGALDDRARAGLVAAVDRHRGWATFADAVVCHGDVHPGNVMVAVDGMVVIDWDLLCSAPAGWDHGPMMTWASRWGGGAGEYEAFASGYGASFVEDPAAQAFAELRLVAATLMRVLAAERSPAAADEAERRLRYWRGDPDAPMWSAQ